ncbi:hypothetical protein PACTADRAFT_34038 [Pachysolen tannophilus NRRL Y-2460]|uniref:N-acetyltransferase domain-containing protein n=1 Tax=Pachysolen tannophilus NRRL Y-2460 TaxID=669874 RepID=A0A1E4TUM5_PACTA|nr:hypothetical protein PACTADRAFT_34038 [Pachysolen tannophilus NRRL Y-2460]
MTKESVEKAIVTKSETFHLDNEEKTLVTMYAVNNVTEVPEELVETMVRIFNNEIEKGDTYPHDKIMTIQEFKDYWFQYFTGIMLVGKETLLLSNNRNFDKEFLGTFYIKPNYIGRCSHNCNAGFIVNPEARGKKIGTAMGKQYLKWAPQLGYTYSVFNLVFETNIASWKIWDSLGFQRIGRVKNAAVLKGHEKKVDAIVFGKDL